MEPGPQFRDFHPHDPQLAMFMTPREIRAHYRPFTDDRKYYQGRVETDDELWRRKGLEARSQGIATSIRERGVLNPVQLQLPAPGRTPEILGGHHRIAAADQDTLIPVIHHENYWHARQDRHHPYNLPPHPDR